MTSVVVPPWHPHLDVLVILGAVVYAYVWADRSSVVHATRAQRTLFFCGVGVMLVAAYWPLHDLAEYNSFALHMVQHLLFQLVAVPLVLLGLPDEIARRIMMRPGRLGAVLRGAVRPGAALALSMGFVVFSHWPIVVDAAVRIEPLHFVLHVALVLTSVAMWWPVLSPTNAVPRLAPQWAVGYLIIQTIIPTVPASFLTWTGDVVYHGYDGHPTLWGLSTADDQRLAGLIMKIIGGMVIWGYIAAVFFRWASQSERADRAERAERAQRASSTSQGAPATQPSPALVADPSAPTVPAAAAGATVSRR